MIVENNSKTLLSLENINVKFKSFFRNIYILKDISFDINSHEILTIIGSNGSGKSSILKVIYDSIEYTGNIRKNKNLKISLMPQKVNLKSTIPLSVMDFFKILDCKIDYKMLERYSVFHDTLSKKINNLSGGKQQTILFLSCLMNDDSNLLLLDEPESGVDKKTRDLMYEDLNAIKTKKSVVMVSHEDGIVSKFSDRIICVNDGKIHCSGNKENLSNYEDSINFYNHI